MATSEPLQPGLVYETSTIDYLNFLCYIGFNVTAVKVISKTVPHNFNCPKDLSSDHVSNINYPSIAINFSGKRAVNVSRTVTNVGEEDETDLSSSFLLSWQIVSDGKHFCVICSHFLFNLIYFECNENFLNLNFIYQNGIFCL